MKGRFWVQKHEVAYLRSHVKMRGKGALGCGGLGVYFWNDVSDMQKSKDFVYLEVTLKRAKRP
jgi:hypothetical protein